MQTPEWSNYETWVVAQWLRIDEWTETEVQAVAAALTAGAGAAQRRATWQLAEWLRARLEGGFPDLEGGGIYERLLHGAFEHVDWDALADYIVAAYGLRERLRTRCAA